MRAVRTYMLLILALTGISGCSNNSTSNNSGDDSGKEIPAADGDTDGDADSDSDGDGDTDGDGDADGDSDSDSDADGDTDTDTDGDADGDSGREPDTHTDTNTGTDSEAGADSATETGAMTDTSSESSEIPDSGTPSNGDTDSVTDSSFEVCRRVTAELTRVNPRVMLLQDKSYSMIVDEKWTQAMDAIDTVLSDYDALIDFGFDIFPNGPRSDVNSCELGSQAVMDVAPLNGDSIRTALEGIQPSGATPLYLILQHYLLGVAVHFDPDQEVDTDTATIDTDVDTGTLGDDPYATVFENGAGPSYIIIISDGRDSCGPDGNYYSNVGVDTDDLASITSALLAERNIRTIVIGFGEGAYPAELNAIAGAGGTPFNAFITASNGSELTAALNSIAQVVAVSCEFDVGDFSEDVDYERVIVTFDGVTEPRNDNNCAQNLGWSWRDASRTAIRFCQDACDRLQTGDIASIEVKLACSDDEIIILE